MRHMVGALINAEGLVASSAITINVTVVSDEFGQESLHDSNAFH